MNLSKFVHLIMLLIILWFGFYIRIANIEKIPSGLYVDEAVTGYNAYSILKTGKDEYGKAWPVVFRLFGSYSPPLYIYLTAPVISLAGLNIFSVRFISVLSGVLLIGLVYFFLKSQKSFQADPKIILFCTFLFAITPWAVFYSRAGYEINLGFLLFSSGCLLSFYGLKRPVFLALGLIVLSLSFYTAHAQRFLTPLFVFGFVVLFFKDLRKIKVVKYSLIGLIIGLIIQIPNLAILFTPAFNSKYSLFYTQEILNQAVKLNNFIPFYFGVVLAFIHEFGARVLTYFSPRSLFFMPDSDLQRSIPEVSVFYSWMVIPYFAGLFYLWRERHERMNKLIMLLALVCVIPGALTVDPFSTQRNLPLLLPLFLIISLGLVNIYQRINKKVFWMLALVVVFFSLINLWRSLFVLLPNERAMAWGYGIKELSAEIKKYPQEHFIIDQSRQKPTYSGLLFFLEYPPDKYQRENNNILTSDYYDGASFDQNKSVGNVLKSSIKRQDSLGVNDEVSSISFTVENRNIDWLVDVYRNQILVGDEFAISAAQAKEHFLTKIFEIKDPIGQIVFVGYKTDPKQKCLATSNFAQACRD